MIRKFSMILVVSISIVLLVACSEDPAAEIEQLIHNYSIGALRMFPHPLPQEN